MVSDWRRAELERLASLPEDQQDEWLKENVPPHEREQFIRDLQTLAAEEGSFFDELLNRIFGSITADTRADRLSEQAIAEASSGDVEHVRVPGVPNTNYLGVPHENLKRWSVDDNEPGDVGRISNAYFEVSNAYKEMNTAVSQAVKILRGAWEGDAADAAASYGSQLAQYADASSQNARLASEVVAAQADASETFRNAMPDPVPFSWDEEMRRARSANDPFDSVSILLGAFDKQKRSQEAHEQAARVAANFDNSTYTTVSKAPVFAEPPKFDGSGSAESSSSTGGGDKNKAISSIGTNLPRVSRPTSQPTGTSSRTSRSGGRIEPPKTGTNNRTGDSSGSSRGGVRLPDGSRRLPDGTIVKPDGTRILPDGTRVLPDGTRILPDGTKVLPDGTRVLPNGRVIPPGNTSTSGFDPAGTGSRSGSLAGSSAYGSTGVGGGSAGGGAGGVAGFGPLGSGAAGGAAGGALGAGKGAGVIGPGSPGAAGAGAAAARAGAGGFGPRGMAGMMGGAAGARGQGAEDKEHKDQYYIKQEMDPGLKVEYDEHGEKLIDETTGMTVVPSVIGE